MSINKMYYFRRGYADVMRREIVAFGSAKSWQEKAYRQGYESGMIYLEAEAILEGFESVSDYRAYLLKQTIKD